MAYIYILYSSSKDRYYIGSTSDFERRLHEHNNGEEIATRNGTPWKSCLVQSVSSLQRARKIEMRIKRWKSRRLLERIITDGFIRIVE